MTEPDSPRVALRPLRREDADLVVRWRSRPEVLAELFSPRPPTLAEHEAWFRALGEHRREYVILAGAEQRPVGTVGLSRIDRLHGTAEFGILVGEADATGKGVATEAGRQILRIAFAELNLNRVYLHVFADNARAATLYRRLDFVEEGILRQHVRKDGAYRNVLVMGLLAEEWRAAQS